MILAHNGTREKTETQVTVTRDCGPCENIHSACQEGASHHTNRGTRETALRKAGPQKVKTAHTVDTEKPSTTNKTKQKTLLFK